MRYFKLFEEGSDQLTTIIIDAFVKKSHEEKIEVKSILELYEQPFFGEQDHKSKKNLIFIMIENVFDEKVSDKNWSFNIKVKKPLEITIF